MRTIVHLAVAALCVLPLTGAAVPRKAPEFAIQLPGGKQQLLSSYRGKVVVLEFLYTTCPACQRTSQHLSKLNAEYGTKGFQALGVAFNDMSQMLVPDFVRDFKVNYPVGFSTRDTVHNFLAYDPNLRTSVPQIVIIDKQGMIRQQSAQTNDSTIGTEENLRMMVEKLLKESSARKAAAKRSPS